MDNFSLFLIWITILIFSVVIHEVSHGAIANILGDPTARKMGRLTLNPLPHIDPMGSVIVPLLLLIPALFGAPAFVFGWAKPVPYNPLNLKNKRWGPALVGVAGPASNLFLAVVFGLLLRIIPFGANPALLGVVLVFMVIVYLNLLLAIFNSLPIPPLDGSKVLFSAFSRIPYHSRVFLERNGFLFLVLFILFGFQIIMPILHFLFSFLTGISSSELFG